MRTSTPKTIYLKDYEPPYYTVKKIDLTVRIFDTHTEVVSSAVYKRSNPDAKALVLDGENMTLKSIRLNGKELAPSGYTADDHSLTIPDPGSDFALEITTH